MPQCTETPIAGRWHPSATELNVPSLPLAWADFDEASTAMIGRKIYATARKHPNGWMARLSGWLWEARPEVKRKLRIKETGPRLFCTREEAKAAIEAAWSTPRNKVEA